MTKEKQIEEIARVLCGMANSCDKCMFKKTNCYEYQEAKALYEADFRKQEWISVEERLPEEWISVLGYMTDAGDYPSVRECYRVGRTFFFPSLSDRHPVSHWMELPEPPKMKGE